MPVRLRVTPTPHCLWQGVYYPTHAAEAAASQGAQDHPLEGWRGGRPPPLGGEPTPRGGGKRLARYLHLSYAQIFLIYFFISLWFTVDIADN